MIKITTRKCSCSNLDELSTPTHPATIELSTYCPRSLAVRRAKAGGITSSILSSYHVSSEMSGEMHNSPVYYMYRRAASK